MYAIVEIAGHQYKVQKDQQIFVNRLDEEEGAKLQFDDVLLIDNSGNITVGAPVISGAAVTAKVDRHLKGDKVIVFKKKRRKGYRKKNGFRASLTEITIDGILEKGAKASPKKEKKVDAPVEAKAAAPKKEAPKKEASKKEAPKKEAPKKETPKAKAPKKETPKAKAPKAEAKPKAAAKPKASKGDDLKKIEGVGPKISEILAQAGLDTFAKVGKSTPDKIREILAEAGNRYKSHDPESWPEQAQMAADGKWDELKEWQDAHDGGRKK
jgi:large subunit ribosomal protein L21